MSTVTESPADTIAATINKDSFQDFLSQWDNHYKNEINKIALFNTEKTSLLTGCQKSYFVKAFYHIRGHFHDFLWFMGNHAPDVNIKKIILSNIGEEFGNEYGSHEQLYYLFAESMSVDIKHEIQTEETYEPYIKAFNKGHLNWLYAHEWTECLSAFAAYEHLDNIDYIALSKLANSLGTTKEGLIFFKVHEKVEHFKPLNDILEKKWLINSDKIKAGFNFISSHQLSMWTNLSKRIFVDGTAQD